MLRNTTGNLGVLLAGAMLAAGSLSAGSVTIGDDTLTITLSPVDINDVGVIHGLPGETPGWT